jgi:cytochrome P450
LAFGEDLGQLSSSTYNAWVESVFVYVRVIVTTRVALQWPGLSWILGMLVPAKMKQKRMNHTRFAAEKVDKRMTRKTTRPDIWTYVTKNDHIEGGGLAKSELRSNGALFMLAGTETTATELSGLTYLLLKNPEKLGRLKREIRAAFSTLDDMTMTKLSQLSYLQACIEEGLRLYPPVPSGLPRITPDVGAMVCGRWVPGGVSTRCDPWFAAFNTDLACKTMVQCPIYAALRSTTNFNKPETFAPERFLPDCAADYALDRRDAFNPFSFGPRNCLG